MNFYNEIDRKTAAWLKDLIKCEALPVGKIDTRSICEVQPSDLQGATQCHFFAGIGGWPYALQLAGWPEDRLVWTGSCPCQPFSCAGKQLGVKDDRHLWPYFAKLIAKCRPSTVFGEQVAGRAGREWLSGVRADLEAMGYAVGAADLCAAGVGAPHVRQRLYWVANLCGARLEERKEQSAREECSPAFRGCSIGRLEHSSLPEGTRLRQQCQQLPRPSTWKSFDVLGCSDGKTRRVESGTFPLAYGVSGRVGLLRGYGNAIVPQVASTFVKAFLQTQC
jgi:DNA (cytosine-5)-methyltransferase 1